MQQNALSISKCIDLAGLITACKRNGICIQTNTEAVVADGKKQLKLWAHGHS